MSGSLIAYLVMLALGGVVASALGGAALGDDDYTKGLTLIAVASIVAILLVAGPATKTHQYINIYEAAQQQAVDIDVVDGVPRLPCGIKLELKDDKLVLEGADREVTPELAAQLCQ